MKIIAVTGGKGGVGKTTISANLAMSFAKAGKRVLLFDADLGLANVDLIFGLKPRRNIHDYITGKCTLSEVCMDGPYGIKIIPSASGIQDLADLSADQTMDLIRAFSGLAKNIDVMLIDLASGISRQVIDLTRAAQNILLVVCNDPSSLMDSYAVIKILHQQHAREKFGIVINKVQTQKEGSMVFLKFQEIVSRFMNVNVQFLGHIPGDSTVDVAARENVTIVERYPFSPAATALNELSRSIDNWVDEMELNGGIQYFFEQLVNNANKADELCRV